MESCRNTKSIVKGLVMENRRLVCEMLDWSKTVCDYKRSEYMHYLQGRFDANNLTLSALGNFEFTYLIIGL